MINFIKDFFRSLLSPTGEISLGSVCTFLLIFVYLCLLVFSFFMEKKLPITATEFTAMVAAIYGIKKIGTIVGTITESYKVLDGNKVLVGNSKVENSSD